MQTVKRRGFTLIELVIVVSIAAIFYSLVLPSIPTSIAKKSSLTIEEALLRLMDLKPQSRDSKLRFMCQSIDECGFYDGLELLEGGYSLALKEEPQEYERDGLGSLRKKQKRSGEPSILLRVNKYGVLFESIYFCDDNFLVIGGTKKIMAAKGISEAAAAVYAIEYAALSEDLIAK